MSSRMNGAQSLWGNGLITAGLNLKRSSFFWCTVTHSIPTHINQRNKSENSNATQFHGLRRVDFRELNPFYSHYPPLPRPWSKPTPPRIFTWVPMITF